MDYREINIAPEDKELNVVWGKESVRPEYGAALRISRLWYIKGQSNPYADGRPCATPDAWLPKDRTEWTQAERKQIDLL